MADESRAPKEVLKVLPAELFSDGLHRFGGAL